MCRLFYKRKTKNRLYIIGNGFDLSHNIRSSYSDFKEYVRNENYDLFNSLEKYFNGELWSDFEETLAYIDTDTIIGDATDHLHSYGAEDWSDAYHHDYQYEIQQALNVVTEQLKECFLKWVLQLEIPTEPLLNVSGASRFLNFNYTSTLEMAYKIKPSNILYVHGKAINQNSLLILGHSRQPSKESSFSNGNDEDTDVRVAQGNELLDQYFEDTYKNTEQIISENEMYFHSLKNIKEVHVLGHSLSEVDMKYFQIVTTHIRADAKWFISYNRENGKEKRKDIIARLGVNPSNISLISSATLKIKI